MKRWNQMTKRERITHAKKMIRQAKSGKARELRSKFCSWTSIHGWEMEAFTWVRTLAFLLTGKSTWGSNRDGQKIAAKKVDELERYYKIGRYDKR